MPAQVEWTFDCDTQGISGAELVTVEHAYVGPAADQGRLIVRVSSSDTTKQAQLNVAGGAVTVNANLSKYFIIAMKMTGTGNPAVPISAMLVFRDATGTTSATQDYTESDTRLIFNLTGVARWQGTLDINQIRLKRGEQGAALDWPNVVWEIDWMALADSAAYVPPVQDMGLCRPFSLNKARRVLDTFQPPAGRFVPGVDYRHAYQAWSTAGGGWIRKGTLAIERKGRADGRVDLSVDYDRTGISGYSYYLSAASVCKPDELMTPQSWQFASKMATAANAAAYAMTGLSGSGAVETGQLTIAIGAQTLQATITGGWTHKYHLFDAVQNLAGTAVPPLHFTLIDEYDQARGGQTLEFHRNARVELGGIVRDLTAWRLKGEGVIPAAFWLDRWGRCLFMMSGLEIYVLESETQTAFARWWDFDKEGDREGWSPNAAVGNIAVTLGSLTFNTIADDPQWTSPAVSIDAAAYRYLFLRLKNGTTGTGAQLFWSNAQGGFAPERSIAFPVGAQDAAPRDYVIDLSQTAGWTGTITRLRLDPVASQTGPIEIDYLGIGSTAPAPAIRTGVDASQWVRYA